MAKGIATDIFEKERRNQSRTNLYDAILGLRQNPDDFLMPEPDKPVYDTDRAKDLRQLSGVAALGEGIGALVNTIGLARDENNFQPAPSRVAELGVQSFNELANMDAEHRDLLNQWGNNVFRTRQGNQRIRQQVDSANRGVDLQAAQQQYQDYARDEEANRQAEQLKNEIARKENLREEEAFVQAGLRLITQGQEKAGVAALAKAGLSTEEIAEAIQQRAGTGNIENIEGDPVVRNMITRYRELEQSLTPYDPSTLTGDFDADGKPLTPAAREYERLSKDIETKDLYDPRYQVAPAGEGGGGDDDDPGSDWDPATDPKVQQGQQQANRFYQQSLVTNLVGASPENTEQIMNQLYELGQQNGQTPQQVDTKVNEQLVKNIRAVSDVNEQRRIAEILIQNWQRQGFTPQQIEQAMQALFGGGSGQGQQTQTSDYNQAIYE